MHPAGLGRGPELAQPAFNTPLEMRRGKPRRTSNINIFQYSIGDAQQACGCRALDVVFVLPFNTPLEMPEIE